jgi:hypothetical protein
MHQASPEIEPSLFATVDFRAFFETVRLRWWVVPVVVATSIGFLQAQDSDLRTQPETWFVSRGYEVGSPFNRLSAVGINLNVLEVPSPDTQLLMLKSNDVRAKIAEQIGRDVEVQFPVNWESPATFTCNSPVKEDCTQAIDAYVSEAMEIRREAILAGIKGLRSVLSDLQVSKPDPIIESQLAALAALERNLEVPIVLVDSFEQAIGNTVNDVRRPTLLMGLVAGLFISLLILLQLTFSDSRVRTPRQLLRLIGSDSFLGKMTTEAHDVRDRRVALVLHDKLTATSRKRIRLIPIRSSWENAEIIKRLSSLTDASCDVAKPFTESSVLEIAGNPNSDAVDLLLVRRNHDLRKDVVEGLIGLRRSNRHLAGVLLVD